MTGDKPLHVRVAEALGWVEVQEKTTWTGLWRGPLEQVLETKWMGWYPYTPLGHPCPRAKMYCLNAIPVYDTDWSATGPLIEKHGFELHRWQGYWSAEAFESPGGTRMLDITGETPLIAVCNLILALAEAGKL